MGTKPLAGEPSVCVGTALLRHAIAQPAFQVRRPPAYEPWMTGTLVYPDVFWELDCMGLRDPDA